MRDTERAVTSGTCDAGRGLKTELRRQVASAGFGQRLANSWRDQLCQLPADLDDEIIFFGGKDFTALLRTDALCPFSTNRVLQFKDVAPCAGLPSCPLRDHAYTLSAQSKLVLTAHEVYLPKPKLAVEGPGGVQASFDFPAATNTAAGCMLTVTLANDLDGTVCA